MACATQARRPATRAPPAATATAKACVRTLCQRGGRIFVPVGRSRSGSAGQARGPPAAAPKSEVELLPPRRGGRGRDKKEPGGTDLTGPLSLLVVAVLWGSYAPALRLVYTMEGPPAPATIMAVRALFQAALLLSVNAAAASRGGGGGEQPEADEGSGEGAGRLLLMGGIELGLWNWLASSAQTVGLELTTATRATFLIQATALLTPLLATQLSSSKPSRNVWIGCGVALAGTLLISSDKLPASSEGAEALQSLGGDAAILTAAVFYSLATVRLSYFAPRTAPLQLAAVKSAVLCTAALSTFGVAAWSALGQGESLSSLWPGYASPEAWAVLLWSAAGPGALAAFLHAKGQSTVPPADAQIIFSTVPLWSAAFAWLLLGGEVMGQYTQWVGGAAILAAGVIASQPSDAEDPG